MTDIEQIRDAFHLIHRVATGQSDRAYMSVPADPQRDADLIVSAAIDELEALRAERDALKAQVEKHASDLGALRSAVHDALPLDYPDGPLIKQVPIMGAELLRLRAQVAELEAEVVSWRATARDKGESGRKAAAERDALQKAADANMALAETLDRTLAATLDERDALRAQVEAARAVAQEMDAGWRIEAAMDEAVKPASCDCRRGCVKCSPWLW